MYKEVLENLFEIIKHFCNKKVLGAFILALNFKWNFIVKHNRHTAK